MICFLNCPGVSAEPREGVIKQTKFSVSPSQSSTLLHKQMTAPWPFSLDSTQEPHFFCSQGERQPMGRSETEELVPVSMWPMGVCSVAPRTYHRCNIRPGRPGIGGKKKSNRSHPS